MKKIIVSSVIAFFILATASLNAQTGLKKTELTKKENTAAKIDAKRLNQKAKEDIKPLVKKTPEETHKSASQTIKEHKKIAESKKDLVKSEPKPIKTKSNLKPSTKTTDKAV